MRAAPVSLPCGVQQAIKSDDFIPKNGPVFVLDDSWAFLVPADLEQVSPPALKVGHSEI